MASFAASTVPNAGMSLVLQVPGVGYLETGMTNRKAGGDGNMKEARRISSLPLRTLFAEGQKNMVLGTRSQPPPHNSPKTNVARFPGPLALFSLSPSTMLTPPLLLVQMMLAFGGGLALPMNDALLRCFSFTWHRKQRRPPFVARPRKSLAELRGCRGGGEGKPGFGSNAGLAGYVTREGF